MRIGWCRRRVSVGSQSSGEMVRHQPNAGDGDAVVIVGVETGQAGLGVMALADPRLAGVRSVRVVAVALRTRAPSGP